MPISFIGLASKSPTRLKRCLGGVFIFASLLFCLVFGLFYGIIDLVAKSIPHKPTFRVFKIGYFLLPIAIDRQQNGNIVLLFFFYPKPRIYLYYTVFPCLCQFPDPLFTLCFPFYVQIFYGLVSTFARCLLFVLYSSLIFVANSKRITFCFVSFLPVKINQSVIFYSVFSLYSYSLGAVQTSEKRNA